MAEHAFPKVKSAHDTGSDGMTYYQWLVGQLANNPAIIKLEDCIENWVDYDKIANNILKVADTLIKKMEEE